MNPPSENNPSRPKDPDALIADISRLMAEAEEMLSESTSHHAEEKIELLREQHEEIKNRFASVYAALKSRVAAFAEQTDSTIRAYPYEAATVALGLGMVLGVCLRRRSGRGDTLSPAM